VCEEGTDREVSMNVIRLDPTANGAPMGRVTTADGEGVARSLGRSTELRLPTELGP
jgi:hypothetical protein